MAASDADREARGRIAELEHSLGQAQSEIKSNNAEIAR